MMEDTAPPEGYPRHRFALLMVALALLVGLTVWLRFAADSRPNDTPGFEETIEADLLMKYYLFQDQFFSSLTAGRIGPAGDDKGGQPQRAGIDSSADELRRRAIALYREAARDHPYPYFLRRLVLIEYPSRRADVIRKLAQAKRPRNITVDVPPLAEEAAMWRDIFVSETLPSPSQVAQSEDIIGKLRLGWYEDIALFHLYDRAGMDRQAELALGRASKAAATTVFRVSGLMLVLILTGLTGLVLLILYWTRKQAGLRPELFPALRLPEHRRSLLTGYLLEVFVVAEVLFLVVQGVLASFAMQVIISYTPQPSGLVMALFQTGIYVLWGLLSILYLRYRLRLAGFTLADIGLRSTDVGRDVLWGMGGYAAALPLLALVMILTQYISRYVDAPEHPLAPLFAGGDGWLAKLILLLLISVAAPIVEEILFRGALFTCLRGRWGALTAVLISAFVFAVVHPILGFFGIFVLGSVFAVLFYQRASLLSCMIAHGLNNGVAFIFYLIMTG